MNQVNSIQSGKNAIRRVLLPRPRGIGAEATRTGPIVVAGMFQTANGIGRAARACFDALQSEGLAPLAVDLSAMFNQVDTPSELALSPMPQDKTGTLILFANGPETEMAIYSLGLRRWHNWRIIGAWAWELTVAPSGWARPAEMLSEIWYPSQYVTDAFAGLIDAPCRTIPHYVSPGQMKPRATKNDKESHQPLSILTLADGRSSLPRKNLTATINMFQKAFPKDRAVELVVKCRNLHMFPSYQREVMALATADDRIRVIDETLCKTDLAKLFACSDIILSAHRAEGFGLHLAEAMAAGRTVVATGWSGNLEFMTPDNSILLPYKLKTVSDPSGIYSGFSSAEWAEVDTDAGARALRDLMDNPRQRHSLSEAARRSVPQHLASHRYTDALFERAPRETAPA